jgi:hypothetical protein
VGGGGQQGALGVAGALPEVGKVHLAQPQHLVQGDVDIGDGDVARFLLIGLLDQRVADQLQEVGMAGGDAQNLVQRQVIVDDVRRDRLTDQADGRLLR